MWGHFFGGCVGVIGPSDTTLHGAELTVVSSAPCFFVPILRCVVDIGDRITPFQDLEARCVLVVRDVVTAFPQVCF